MNGRKWLLVHVVLTAAVLVTLAGGCGTDDPAATPAGKSALSSIGDETDGHSAGRYVDPEACCFADGRCEELMPQACMDGGGQPQGPRTTCGMVDCGAPATEACCFEDGRCEDLVPKLCMREGGQPQGPDTTCQTADCGPVDCERLCHEEGGRILRECMEAGGTEEDCEAQVRAFIEECLRENCPPPPPNCERRCQAEGRRILRECIAAGGTEEDCAAEARAFVEGCVRENCPPRPPNCERRCHGEGGHIFRECMDAGGTEEDCGAEARAFVEACIRDNCEAPPHLTEACCFADARCKELAPDACTAGGGQPQGPESTCRAVDCGNDGGFVLCHRPPGNPDNARTITVGSQAAVDAHLAHGDTLGPCEGD